MDIEPNGKGNAGFGAGAVLDEAINVYSKNFMVFLKYAAVWAVPVMLSEILVMILRAVRKPGIEPGFVEINMKYAAPVFFLLFVFSAAASIAAAINAYANRKDSFAETAGIILRGFLGTLTAFMVYAVIACVINDQITHRGYQLMQFIPATVIPPYFFMLLAISPLVFFAARYVFAPAAAAAGRARPFKTSVTLASGNYISVIVVLAIVEALYRFFGDLRMYYGFGIIKTLILGAFFLPFFASVAAVMFKKAEELKKPDYAGPALSKPNLAAGLIAAIIALPVLLAFSFPELPGKIFDASETLMSFTSRKMEFPGGITLKRAKGWKVEGDSDMYYRLKNPKFSYMYDIRVYPVKLTDAVFEKGKNGKENIKKLKHLAFQEMEDDPAMCSYLITDKIDERNGKDEYPAGVLRVQMKMITKRNTVITGHAVFYRVVKNKYVIFANYETTDEYYADMDEKYKKDDVLRREAAKKEAAETDGVLAEMLFSPKEVF